VQPIIIARAPGHITLGFNHAPFTMAAEASESLTITVAVNYSAYAIVAPSRATDVHITVASGDDLVWHELYDSTARQSESGLPQAIAQLFGVGGGVSIFLSAQAPLSVGLGISSGMTIAMIKALAFSCGLDLEPADVAALACYVRVDLLGLRGYDPCQYAAAYGGLNCISSNGKTVKIDPLRISPETQQSLEKQLMLFSAPRTRPRSELNSPLATAASEQEPLAELPSRALLDVSRALRTAIEEGDWKRLGEVLQWSWLEQRRFAHVEREDPLASALDTAIDRGALGGQGIGRGSGLLVVLCPEDRQPDVTHALGSQGLAQLPLAFDPEGVEVMEAMPRAKLTSSSSLHDQSRSGGRLLGLGKLGDK
jgi:D-glycero-alpha-D-manno-heptose-7-phosphate kinase